MTKTKDGKGFSEQPERVAEAGKKGAAGDTPTLLINMQTKP